MTHVLIVGSGSRECMIIKKLIQDTKTGKIVVRVNPDFFRPTEVDKLLGDPTKAIKKLNWNPRSTTLEQMIEEMINEDLKRLDTL